MDNLITGIIGMILFLAFIIGLAESIQSWPFSIIVGIVSIMALIDFYQSGRAGVKKDD